MNKITLLGRFTRDPEIRYTNTGKVVCQATIAVDRPFTNQVCGNNFSKEHRILVDGRLQIRSYDGKDGAKRYVAEVIVNQFYFIEKKSTNTSDNKASTTENNCMEAFGSSVPFDEELPF